MNWRFLSAGAVLLAQALSACDSLHVLSVEKTKVLLNEPIRIGESRDAIVESFGEPYKQERYGTTEFLFYQTVWQVADQAAKQNPIAVLDGKVVGVGRVNYEKIVQAYQKGWGETVVPR